MPQALRICATLLMLITATSCIWGEEPKPAEIRPHDRVLCIQDGCVIKSENNGREHPVPFGAILKISKINEGRCLVYNHFMDGWTETSNFVSLSDQRLLTIIERSSPSQSRKEYALGNYFSRRELSKAKKHFDNAVELDKDFDHAFVDRSQLLAMLGDDKAVEANLVELNRFPHREDVVLAYALQNSPTEKTLIRCNEVMKTSSFLKGEMANFLHAQNDVRLLSSANELAFDAFLKQKCNPWRSHLMAVIYTSMQQGLLDDENMSRKAVQMANAQWVTALSNDIYFSMGYECLALTHIGMGKKGEAIRLAQGAMRFNPRSYTAARLIARFSDAAAAGESFKDATGAEISPLEILPMAEIERGLKQIAELDLPLLPGNDREEELRLHGHAAIPTGREVDEAGRTALHLLVNDRNGLCLSYLARVFQLDWNRFDAEGRAPIHRAVEANDLPLLDVLVKSGADLSFKTASGDSVAALACKTENPAMVACVIRSDKVSEQDLRLLRKFYRASSNAALTDLQQLAHGRVVARLDELVANELTQLTNGYAAAKSQLQADQKAQEQMENFIPLSNAPILVPGYIADIGKYNPARASMMMNRRIAEEVAEHIALHSRNQEAAQEQVRQSETQAIILRRQSSELADQIVTIAYYSLSPDEFTRFAKGTGSRIQGLLNQSSIDWKLPFTAAAK